MSRKDLLRESLSHVIEIVNSENFTSTYGENEQQFFKGYKKELEDELEEEVNGGTVQGTKDGEGNMGEGD
jgi:hypothetical protein